MTKRYKKFFIVEGIVLINILLMYLIINTELLNRVPKCLILQKYNLLCPSCGGTRCIEHFLKGDFCQAFVFNKIFFSLLIYGAILNILYIINTLKNEKKFMCIYPKCWHIYMDFSINSVYNYKKFLVYRKN